MTKPSYFHSFGMTDNYFVFLEQTLYINTMKLACSAMTKTAVCTCLEYEPNETSLFHVVHKRTGDLLPIKFTSGALFGMHIVNSYEQDDHIVFDICCYHNDELIKKFYLDYLRHGDQEGRRSFPRPEVRRFVLPLDINKVGFYVFVSLPSHLTQNISFKQYTSHIDTTKGISKMEGY